MKIIFTDIDGVLNSAYYNQRNYGNIAAIEERKVKNLKKIVDATGAVVVVVSRANSFLGKDFNELRINDIKSFGVEPIDSITDIYYQESKVDPIRRWLKRNNAEESIFVVFDDCASNLKQEFGNRFIHITGLNGLTPKYVNEAISILNYGESAK